MSKLIFLAHSNASQYTLSLNKYLHGYYTLQFVCDGSLEVCYGEQCYTLADRPEGWFFPAYPGPRLRFHPSVPGGTWWHRHLAFQGELVEQWRTSGLWPLEPQPAPAGMDGGARLDAITTRLSQGGAWRQARAINLLEALLLDLAEARTASQPSSPWLSTVFSLLGEQFTPDYAQIAQTLGCSVATLRRRFKQELGQSLHEYVIGQRIARARALLSETDQPLREIAQSLGYDSEFFFARQFKQVAQVTPGEYRRSRLFIPRVACKTGIP